MNRVLYLTSAQKIYKNTVVFILFQSESSKIREEMVNTKYSATIMKNI